MSAELQFTIYEDFLHYFLPEGLLDFFEPVMAEQKTHINPTTKVQIQALHLYFDERKHADGWVLLPDNIGEHLCIDETSLQDDLFTILSNKAGHGRQGTIIAMVRGTTATLSWNSLPGQSMRLRRLTTNGQQE